MQMHLMGLIVIKIYISNTKIDTSHDDHLCPGCLTGMYVRCTQQGKCRIQTASTKGTYTSCDTHLYVISICTYMTEVRIVCLLKHIKKTCALVI